MSFDFMKDSLMFDDEERFVSLCEAIEEAIQEVEDGGNKLSDFEVMQAMDFVGFNLYRDNWEEFKKIELPRDFSLGNSSNSRDRKLPN